LNGHSCLPYHFFFIEGVYKALALEAETDTLMMLFAMLLVLVNLFGMLCLYAAFKREISDKRRLGTEEYDQNFKTLKFVIDQNHKLARENYDLKAKLHIKDNSCHF